MDNCLIFTDKPCHDASDIDVNAAEDCSYILKLADFGLSMRLVPKSDFENKESKIVGDFPGKAMKELKLVCGTPSYMAPEILQRQPYHGCPADVWGVGVLLFSSMAGFFPFQSKTENGLYKKILQGNVVIPAFFGNLLKDLVRKMLYSMPRRRLTAMQALKHPWLRNIGSDKEHTSTLISRTEEVDENIIKEMHTMGFHRSTILNSIREDKHDQCTTTYYLLWDRKYGTISVSGMQAIEKPENNFPARPRLLKSSSTPNSTRTSTPIFTPFPTKASTSIATTSTSSKKITDSDTTTGNTSATTTTSKKITAAAPITLVAASAAPTRPATAPLKSSVGFVNRKYGVQPREASSQWSARKASTESKNQKSGSQRPADLARPIAGAASSFNTRFGVIRTGFHF